MVPSSSWLAVRCHFLPSLSVEAGEGRQPLGSCCFFRAALFNVSVVSSGQGGARLSTAQQLTAFGSLGPRAVRKKKKNNPKIIIKKELMFSSGKQEAL